MSAVLKEKSYALEARYVNFYEGGNIAWSNDGKLLYCLCGSSINEVNVLTGIIVRSLRLITEEETDDVIYTFALSPSNEYLVTAHRSSLVRLWCLQSGNVEKLWKSQHKGPVVKVSFNSDSNLVCTSGSDSSLRIWDYQRSCCLCALKDCPGPSMLVEFHPGASKSEIFAVSSDNSIYHWDFDHKSLKYILRGHISQVSAICFENKTSTCERLVSVGRDKVLIVWNLTDGSQIKVIPLYEELVGVFNVSPQTVIVAGGRGNLKMINVQTNKISTILESSAQNEAKILLKNDAIQQLALITAEHHILIYSLLVNEQSVKPIKQMSGFNDEILDICFLGETERFLAMATNSKHIKLYDCETEMDCKIISGHSDTVMTLSTPCCSNLLLSAGKDLSIILWQLDADTFSLNCLAKNISSHTSTIGCISFTYRIRSNFASVCQSGSLKVWHIKENKRGEFRFSVKYATAAHDKEVHCVTYCPNNQIIATASQDKTAKLWSANESALLGTLRGHSRGVWCVRFSPVDQIVLTTSSDCSLRLWSLVNMICLKRLEHSCTVLRAEFLNHGKYIISSESNGLLKLWSVKSNECIQTLEEHEDRIWSLAITNRSSKHFFSAAADSKLIKWRDITDEVKKEAMDKHQDALLQEQSLQNLINENTNLNKAFKLALKLRKPKISYKIINQYVRQKNYNAIRDMVNKLDLDQKNTLLNHVRTWATNSRYTQVSSLVLNYLIWNFLVDTSLQRSLKIAQFVETMIPYVQRHFKRVTELKKDICFLEFIVKNI